MILTEKYKANYLAGFDCRMATFRNNMAFYGHTLSNGMVLGMSGCLSFIYGTPEKNRIPYYTAVGITDQTLEGLSSIFDTYIIREKFDFENKKNILTTLKKNLTNNVLVNAAINRPFLNHLRTGKKKSDFKIEPSNIGFHYVTITEIKGNSITFFETDYRKPLTYDFDTFIELWFFDKVHKRKIVDPHQMCDGKYYTILPPTIKANQDKFCILFAINKVATSFLVSEKEHYYHGIKGIKIFFEEVQNWNELTDKDTLINSIFFLRILEKNLSGGGFGRKLYSFFLSEAASVLADDNLKSIAIEFRNTSKLWANFIAKITTVENIENIAKNDFTVFKKTAKSYANKIISAEQKQFEKLKKWVDAK